jgi:LysR family transcriptional repressor of citA
MKTDSLRTFIALARCRNFTKTAQELLVVQSTVSSRIKELESELGQKLFARDKNNVVLTVAGEMFLSTAIQIVAMEESAIAKINLFLKYADNLTVACAHSLFDCYVLGDAIKFMKENPHISLRLTIAHSHEIIADLSMYNLDVAYTYYPFHHSRYICKPFATEKFILVTNSANRKYLHGITKNELLEVPIIFSDLLNGHDLGELIPEQKIYPLDVNIVSRIIPFLKGGNWYSFLPVGVVKKDIEEGSLIEIPLKDIPYHTQKSYVIYKRYHKKATGLSRWIESNILKKSSQIS